MACALWTLFQLSQRWTLHDFCTTIAIRESDGSLFHQGHNMTFQESIKVCFSKYADFTGRASRAEYWWFMLFILLVSLAASTISPVLSGLFSLATLLPCLAAATRRLHDTNRSGWWQLVALIPVVDFIIVLVFLAQDSKAEAQGVPAT